MPSFTFITSTDKDHAKGLLDEGIECSVPQGFSADRGVLKNTHSHLKWHCGAHAPVEHTQASDGSYAFLIGDAIADTTDEYLSAEELLTMVTEHREKAKARLMRYSGFFAWVVVIAEDCVYCGSDPFGFFPVYYFQGKDSLCISTSLNTLHAHPEYDASVDPVGFCRYIMENGCSSDRTLEKSGKRLNIAESLCYNATSGTLRTKQHVLPGHTTSKSVHSLEDAIQHSVDAMTKAVNRHTQKPVETCLLSGGLDSRQLLEIAHGLGQRPKCVTLGPRHSYESIHARRVARRLGLKWECSGSYSEQAERLLNDELHLLSLGGGFNGMMFWWRNIETLRGKRCLTGLFLDLTFSYIAAENTHPSAQIDDGFARNTLIYSFGVLPDTYKEIFNKSPYKEALITAMNEVRGELESYSSDPNERYWQCLTRYRARSHHGAIIWKNAFYHWPIMPALDVPLTEAIRSIQTHNLVDRKLQKEALIKKCPELASIPLAGIGQKPQPLIHINDKLDKFAKIERKYFRFIEKYIKTNRLDKRASERIWLEAARRAHSTLNDSNQLLDTEIAAKRILSFSNRISSSKSISRDHYSSALLVGGLSWIDHKNSAFKQQP
ncbi:MAG TPA: hypothetical protein DCX06_10365 [Opitutae bacterium]|nr:hypothetical protein [Opitutae bacterium]